MKRILFAAAALAAFGFNTSAMAADSATATVTMGGTVADTCTLQAPTFAATTGAPTNTATTNTSTVALSLADSTTAQLKASGFTLTYAGMCNYAHQVGIKATNGGLLNATPVAPVGGTFVQRIGYTASAVWATKTVAVPGAITSTVSATGEIAAQAAVHEAVIGSNQGDLVLTVGIAAVATPVVAGTYSETLTLKIGATI